MVFYSHFPCSIVLLRSRDGGRYYASSVEREENVIDFYTIHVSSLIIFISISIEF